MKLGKILFAIVTLLCLTAVFAACNYVHEHDWAMRSDSAEHWQECADDQTEKPNSRAPHFDDNDDGRCDECGYVMSQIDNGHKHVFTTAYNTEEHWQACTCGQTTNHEYHQFDSDGVCSCGYKKSQGTHTHSYVTARNATEHWQLCTGCGDTKDRAAHSVAGNYLCSCGYAYDAPATGSLSNSNFWIIGTFTDNKDSSTKGWGETHTDNWKFRRLIALDSNNGTQYVFEREFNSGDEFKIVKDGGGGYWDGEINASNVSASAKQFLGGDGGGNIKFNGNNGYYRVTLHYGSGNPTVDCTLVYGIGATIAPHEHSYSSTWSNDANGHWHQATCEHAELKKRPFKPRLRRGQPCLHGMRLRKAPHLRCQGAMGTGQNRALENMQALRQGHRANPSSSRRHALLGVRLRIGRGYGTDIHSR